jgi:hypothetical protein
MVVAKKSSRSVSPKRKRVSKSVVKRKRVSKSVSKRKTKSRSSKKKRKSSKKKSKKKVMRGGQVSAYDYPFGPSELKMLNAVSRIPATQLNLKIKTIMDDFTDKLQVYYKEKKIHNTRKNMNIQSHINGLIGFLEDKIKHEQDFKTVNFDKTHINSLILKFLEIQFNLRNKQNSTERSKYLLEQIIHFANLNRDGIQESYPSDKDVEQEQKRAHNNRIRQSIKQASKQAVDQGAIYAEIMTVMKKCESNLIKCDNDKVKDKKYCQDHLCKGRGWVNKVNCIKEKSNDTELCKGPCSKTEDPYEATAVIYAVVEAIQCAYVGAKGHCSAKTFKPNAYCGRHTCVDPYNIGDGSSTCLIRKDSNVAMCKNCLVATPK